VRLEVTRRAELAVRALALLGAAEGRVKGRDLAAALDTTSSFIAQVVAPLVQAGWVRSSPGPTGGYSLDADLGDVSVLDVIEAVDGATDTGRCVVADGVCDPANPCVLHAAWLQARARLLESLASIAIPEPLDGAR